MSVVLAKKKARWLIEWKQKLIADLNLAGFPGPITDIGGVEYKAAITGATETRVIQKLPYGVGELDWNKLSPKTLLTISNSFIGAKRSGCGGSTMALRGLCERNRPGGCGATVRGSCGKNKTRISGSASLFNPRRADSSLGSLAHLLLPVRGCAAFSRSVSLSC
jgi:hypothetical protein